MSLRFCWLGFLSASSIKLCFLKSKNTTFRHLNIWIEIMPTLEGLLNLKLLPLTLVYQYWGASLGREDPLREGNGYPLQYSCLENSMDRGAWQATVGSQRVGHNWATNTLNFFSDTGQWVYAIQDGLHLLLVGTAICSGKMWVYPKNLDTSLFYSFLLLSSSKQYLAQGQCPVIFFDRWIFRHLNQSTHELNRGHFLEVLWPSVLGTGHSGL